MRLDSQPNTPLRFSFMPTWGAGGVYMGGEGKRKSTSPGGWRLPPHARPPTSQEPSQDRQGRGPVYSDYRGGAG